MGNEQKKEEKKEENIQGLPTLDDKIVSSPIEETNNLQKPEEINQEQPNIEQKEEMNKVPEVEPIEKYPNDNIKGSKNHLEVQDIMEAKILDIPYKQQKPKESQNINEPNPLVNLEPIKETSYSANFNINADLKNESSNVLRTTDLDLYIKKDQEPSKQSQESMDKKQSNLNQVEEPYIDNNLEVQNIHTTLNIDSLNVNNQNGELFKSNNLNIDNVNNNSQKDYLEINKTKDNNTQVEQPYTFSRLNIDNINTNINTDFSNKNNISKENNNTQVEQPYTFNRLNIDNINTNINTDFSNKNSTNKENNAQSEQAYTFNSLDLNNIDTNINYNNENKEQNEVPYMDNNLEVNNIYTNLNIGTLNSGMIQENNTQSIPTEENDYTFDGNVYKKNNNLIENDYTHSGNIFNNIDNNNINNNLNINEYNYDYNFENNNNNLIQIEQNKNQNMVEDINYIMKSNKEENIQYTNILPSQYLQTKMEDIQPSYSNNINTNININDINNQTNADLNNAININKFSFGELLPRENVENKEIHFTESQNIYNENIPNVEEPKKEIVNESIKQSEIQINNIENNLLRNPNIISNEPPKHENEALNVEGNDNKENLHDNSHKLLVQIEESKTVYINNMNNKSELKKNEQGNNIESVQEIKNEIENKNNLNENNHENNLNNNKNRENSKEGIQSEIDNNLRQENNLDISNQIKEIKEMPEKPFEQRDYIFNKKNIKVIKIEDEETRFCSDLLTPLFKKLFG